MMSITPSHKTRKMLEIFAPHKTGDFYESVMMGYDEYDKKAFEVIEKGVAVSDIIEEYNRLGRTDVITPFQLLISWVCWVGDDSFITNIDPILLTEYEMEVIEAYFALKFLLKGVPAHGQLAISKIHDGILSDCYISPLIMTAFASNLSQAIEYFISTRKAWLLRHFSDQISCIHNISDSEYEIASLISKMQRVHQIKSADSVVDAEGLIAGAITSFNERVSGIKKKYRISIPGFENQYVETGELCVIAARPGVGKTTIAALQAFELAKQGENVLFVSMEESRAAIEERFTALFGGYDSRRLRDPISRKDEAESALALAMSSATELPGKIFIPKIKPSSFEEFKNIFASVMPTFVIVDSVYLMRSKGKHNSNREKIESVVQAISTLSKDEHVRAAFMVTTQLNRVGAGQDPSLEHIAFTDAFGQEASLAIALVPQGEFIKAAILKSRYSPGWNNSLLYYDHKTQTIWSEEDWKSEKMKRISRPISYTTLDKDERAVVSDIAKESKRKALAHSRVAFLIDTYQKEIQFWAASEGAKSGIVTMMKGIMENDVTASTIDDWRVEGRFQRVRHIKIQGSDKLEFGKNMFKGVCGSVADVLASTPLAIEEWQRFSSKKAMRAHMKRVAKKS